MPHAVESNEHSDRDHHYQTHMRSQQQSAQAQLQAMRTEHRDIAEREQLAALGRELRQSENRIIEGAFREAVRGDDPIHLYSNIDAIMALLEIMRRVGSLPVMADLRTATLHTDDPNVLHPLYYEYIPHTNRFFLLTAPARFEELFFANDETLYDIHEVPAPGHAVGTSHRITGRNLLHEQRRLANYVEHQHSVGGHLENKVSRRKGAFFAQSRRI
ncbi:hypothetical protein JCM5353_000827 [Sporobolomyces roseus]